MIYTFCGSSTGECGGLADVGTPDPASCCCFTNDVTDGRVPEGPSLLGTFSFVPDPNTGASAWWKQFITAAEWVSIPSLRGG